MLTRVYSVCRDEFMILIKDRLNYTRSYEKSKKNRLSVPKLNDVFLDEQDAANEKSESSLSVFNPLAQHLKPMTGLWITGLAAQYPPYQCDAADFERYVKKFYSVEKPRWVVHIRRGYMIRLIQRQMW